LEVAAMVGAPVNTFFDKVLVMYHDGRGRGGERDPARAEDFASPAQFLRIEKLQTVVQDY
jgi:hypothetical protein